MANCRGARLAEQCALTADYSEVIGERILPFVFELDEGSSILDPDPGQMQRFCYHIDGVGEDTEAYADLSHFLLVVGEGLTEAMLQSVTVNINGVEQDVVIGENVEVKSADAPDNPTGCPGLKFDFGLDKVGGEMDICFSLSERFAVGPVAVCVYGGGQVASSLAICGPTSLAVASCPATGYQTLSVCVPVTVTPYANAGAATVTCCGAPAVTPGVAACTGTGTSCSFTLTQRLCVAVPVTFGANAVVGASGATCLGVSSEDTCADCGDETAQPARAAAAARTRPCRDRV